MSSKMKQEDIELAQPEETETLLNYQMEGKKEKKRRADHLLNEMALWNDFVLVGKEDKKDQQEDFIKKLKEKQIEVEEKELDGNIFYGLRASEEALKNNPNKSDDVDNKSLANRIRFVNSILNGTNPEDTVDNKGEGTACAIVQKTKGLKDLMKKGVFETRFSWYEDIKLGELEKWVDLLNQQTEKLKDKKRRTDRLLNEMEDIELGEPGERVDQQTGELKDKKRRADRLLNEMAQRNDFVLVGKEDKKDQQEDFIKKLREKQIEVEEEELDGNIFYGLRASEEALKNNPNKSDDVDSKSLANRIKIVDSILNETKINTGEGTACAIVQKTKGLKDLMKKGVFETKFSWYEEERKEKKRRANRLLNDMAQRNDFFLVGEKNKKDQQEDFIKKLKEEQIEVEEKELDGKIFYGLQAPEEVIKEKLHKMSNTFPDSTNSEDVKQTITLTTRIRIVESILNETNIDTGGLKDLMENGMFEKKFCLYEYLLQEDLKDKKRRAKRFLIEMAQRNDFVLVGEKNKKDQQEDFIKKLKEKQIEVEKEELDGNIFYGLRASEETLKNNPNKSDDVDSKSLATRIRIVEPILNETKIDTGEGLKDLMDKGVFKTRFSWYEEELKEKKKWAYCLLNEMEKLKEKKKRTERFLNKMGQWNDFVLVGKKDKKDQQDAFIKKLKEEKQFEVVEIELDGKIFYGLQASEELIKEKLHKMSSTEPNSTNSEDVKKSITPATRIIIVESILKDTKTNTGEGKACSIRQKTEGLKDLMKKGVFETKFSLYEKELKDKKRRTKHLLNEMGQWNDFVLVGKKNKKEKQEAFIEKLKEKQIEVVEKELDGNIFYGLQAPEEVIKKKLHETSNTIPDSTNSEDAKQTITLTTRIIIVDFILNETKINKKEGKACVIRQKAEGLEDLMKKGVFETKFSLHEEELKEKKKRAMRFLNEMAQWNDFVLVGKKNKKDQQEDFIKKLKREQIEVVENELDGNIFYGLRASEEALKDNLCLPKKSDTNKSDDVESKRLAARIRLVNFILNETKINKKEGLEDLMEKGVFEIKFCLYEALMMEYYYILVGPTKKEHEQYAFIEELERKNIKVKTIEKEEQIFYGLRAEEKVFKKYQFLLKVSDTCNSEDMKMSVSLATRIRIVHFILKKTRINTGEGLKDLMDKGVFETKFCLHEENHEKELKDWEGRKTAFYNQPFKKIRKHFGEKVALFYLWMGWYTFSLVPAAAVGLLVFLCGMAFFDNNPLIKEVCDSDITMCPRCEKVCEPWNLKDTCNYAKVSYLFDNKATVAFAIFMAGWATTLLQLWKRHRAKHVSKWEVYDWNEEEEELILEVVNDPECKPKKRKRTYGWNIVLMVVGTLMMLLIIGLTSALVVFRVMIRPLLSDSRWQFIRDYTNNLVVIFGAVLHTITIQIMNRVNRWVSLKVFESDKSNSRSDREKTFTIMMFTFQFFTLFSSLFYIAFFLGRINGYPGNYVRIAGHRLEECHPSGCLTDLFIQMFVIMTLSQIFSNIAGFIKPLWNKRWRKVKRTGVITCCCHVIPIPFLKKSQRERTESSQVGQRSAVERRAPLEDEHLDCWNEQCDGCLLKYWQDNYKLADTDDHSLFYEILNMVIQFSFTTLFVAAFPLAPLLALINNIITIRLAAIKMVRFQRLLVPKKTNSIGVWTNVLEAIGVLAVITNSLVIGITSDFIPRLVYQFRYGPCANGVTDTHCMTGYINSTLMTAYMFDNNPNKFVSPKQRHLYEVTECSFRDYRNPIDHSVTSQYWWVLAARFTFIIAFEHLLLMFKAVAAWFFPSDSLSVKNDRVKNKLGRLKNEKEKNKDKV